VDEPFRWQSQLAESEGRLFGDEEVVERHVGTGEFRGLEFLHVDAHRVLNEVPSGPLGFRWTINAYRGCSHACTYCFARPTHRYLGLNMGDDFDRKIVVYCAGGLRSALAADTLKTLGFTDVGHIEGGFGAWKAAGLPIEDVEQK